MSITAVVPVWNRRKLLERLLATVEAQTLPAAEVLIVDNGSTDGAPQAAKERGARTLAMGHNAGFAAAVNRGIAECRTEWVAVLNSDVELAPDYFEILANTEGWFATGKILRYGSSPALVDGTYDLVCRGGSAWRVGNGRRDTGEFDAPRRIWSAPWTAALFRRSLFDKIGGLEESFESYLEDVDFGLRAAMHGTSGTYEPRAVAWHHGSASLGTWHPETVRRLTRNQIFLLGRHYSRETSMRCWWPIAVSQLLWAALTWRNGKGWAWLRGMREGLESQVEAVHRNDTGVLERLIENETVIREVQQVLGFDTYWRLYFRMTGRAR